MVTSGYQENNFNMEKTLEEIAFENIMADMTAHKEICAKIDNANIVRKYSKIEKLALLPFTGTGNSIDMVDVLSDRAMNNYFNEKYAREMEKLKNG